MNGLQNINWISLCSLFLKLQVPCFGRRYTILQMEDVNILSYVGVTTDADLDWRIDLLDIHKS
jgi:hypothetical protein